MMYHDHDHDQDVSLSPEESIAVLFTTGRVSFNESKGELSEALKLLNSRITGRQVTVFLRRSTEPSFCGKVDFIELRESGVRVRKPDGNAQLIQKGQGRGQYVIDITLNDFDPEKDPPIKLQDPPSESQDFDISSLETTTFTVAPNPEAVVQKLTPFLGKGARLLIEQEGAEPKELVFPKFQSIQTDQQSGPAVFDEPTSGSVTLMGRTLDEMQVVRISGDKPITITITPFDYANLQAVGRQALRGLKRYHGKSEIEKVINDYQLAPTLVLDKKTFSSSDSETLKKFVEKSELEGRIVFARTRSTRETVQTDLGRLMGVHAEISSKGEIQLSLKKNLTSLCPLTTNLSYDSDVTIEIFDVYDPPAEDDIFAEVKRLVDYRDTEGLTKLVESQNFLPNYRFERGCFHPRDNLAVLRTIAAVHHGKEMFIRRRGSGNSELAVVGSLFLNKCRVAGDGSPILHVFRKFGDEIDLALDEECTAFEIYDFSFRLQETTISPSR